MRVGKLIVVVGIDGAGKTSLLQMLKKQNQEIILTREPGGTPYAEAIRRLLFSKDGKQMTKEQQLRLFFEARRDHVQNLIVPGINSGQAVICDRFDACTFAYQRPDKNNLEDLLWKLRKEFVSEFVSPSYVWLQLSVELAMQREAMSTAHNHFDEVDIPEVKSRVEGYQLFFEKLKELGEECLTIDASDTPEQTLQNFLQACPLN